MKHLAKEKTGKVKETKKRWDYWKAKSSMVGSNIMISSITLDVNGLKIPVRSQGLYDCLSKQYLDYRDGSVSTVLAL